MTDPEHPDAVLELVAKATGRALDRRRNSLYRESAIVSAIIALAITLTVSIFLANSTSNDALKNENYLCNTVSFLAAVVGDGHINGHLVKVLPEGGFISSDASLRDQQTKLSVKRIQAFKPGPLKSLLTDPQTYKFTRQSDAQNAKTTAYWTRTLIPQVEKVAQSNCRALTGG